MGDRMTNTLCTEHTPLFMDSINGPERLTPCLWCQRNHWLKVAQEKDAQIEQLQKDLRRSNAALVRHGVEEMRPGNAPDEPVDAHKVQCKCGWVGMTTELVRLDNTRECPACRAEFKALSAWPPLKSNVCTCGRQATGDHESGCTYRPDWL